MGRNDRVVGGRARRERRGKRGSFIFIMIHFYL